MNKRKKTSFDENMKKMLQEREPEANNFFSGILIISAVFLLLIQLAFSSGIIYGTPLLEYIVLDGGAVLALLTAAVCHWRKGRGWWLKYLLGAVLMLLCLGINLLSGYKFWILLALPIVISSRYYDHKLTGITYLFSLICLMIGAVCNAFFYRQLGIMDMDTAWLAENAQIEANHSMYQALMTFALKQ